MKLLSDKVKKIKNASASFKSAVGSLSLSSQQQSKVNKLSDQIESLATKFGSGDESILVKENLPDTEFLEDLVSKFRLKLKVIDDTSTAMRSLKGDKNKNNLLSAPKVHEISLNMTACLHRIEVEMVKHLALTDFLLRVKVLVINPLRSLLVKITDMNSLKGAVTSDSNDLKVLQSAEESYEVTRSHALLASVARNSEEAEMIERDVRAMLVPLREITGLTGQKDKKEKVDKTGSPTPAIIRSLVPLLSCPDSELLARCVTKSTIDGFSASVMELQANTRSASSLENNQGSDTKSDFKSKAMTNWYDSITHERLIRVSQFDFEYFAAYIQDWQQRVETIAKISSNADFDKQYKRHCGARAQLQKARELYEKSLQRKNQVEARNNDVYKQFEELSILVTNICRREFNTDIELLMA
eukprot:CAMPEP_0119046186 /NCGR_PEP_ID=MMETSP1177-20130426/44952_1 /TAXON_ID=2985 /ORGANISM="Ochromonas sp, Strain CCMP1899" /LENGTH=413 /DNA_ID=CAMNT_0007018981 /DNA_START=339 /DNA_END=1580 /DNA_ORIENTATION=+